LFAGSREINLFGTLGNVITTCQAAQNSSERSEFVRRAIEAKGRIILNSSPTVLNALAKYSAHAELASEESYSDFAKLLAAMRSDIGGDEDQTFEAKVRAILFEGTKK
jgi:hypothetical protein